MDFTDDDFDKKVHEYLARQYWLDSEAFSEIGLGPDLRPEEAMARVKSALDSDGLYESQGEYIGMGNLYRLRITKVESSGPEYSGPAYEIRLSTWGNWMIIVVRCSRIEDIFPTIKVIRQLIEFAGWSSVHAKRLMDYDSDDFGPILYDESD